MASFREAIMHSFPFRDHPLSKCKKFSKKLCVSGVRNVKFLENFEPVLNGWFLIIMLQLKLTNINSSSTIPSKSDPSL